MASTTFSGPVVSTNGFTGALTGAVTATTASASTSLTVGGGSAITYIKKGTIAVDAGSCGDNDIVEVSLTITGAAAGDTVIMNPPAAGQTAGLGFAGAYVSSANTVKLRLINVSGGTVDEGSLTWEYCLIRV